VGCTQLAAASWQRPSSFITPDPGFPGQAQHSAGSPGSLLSWHGSLWFLVVPDIAKMPPFWQLRGHHTEHDGIAAHHSKTSLPEVSPVMEGPLG
jgi:hypothetical protein